MPWGERLSSRLDELANEIEGRRVKANASFSKFFYMGCHWKAWPRLKVGLSTLNSQLRKIPHRCARMLGF